MTGSSGPYRCSVAKLCPTLCNSMDYSTPGSPNLHYLQSLLIFMFIELLMPPNHLILCHLLILLPSIFSSIRVFSNKLALHISGQGGASASASVLQMNSQGWFSLRLTGLVSLLSKGLSRVFSSTTVWKHQFFSTQPSLCSNTKLLLWLYGLLSAKWCLWVLESSNFLPRETGERSQNFILITFINGYRKCIFKNIWIGK